MTSDATRPSVLVVGSDGSEADTHVADIAAAIARSLRARMILVRAIDMGTGDEDPSVGPNAPAHAALAARVAERTREAQRSLDEERARLSAAAVDVDVEVRLVEARPYAALARVALEPKEPAWIVIGARAGTSVLGRTVDQVLRRSTVPVLVVPDGATWVEAGPVLAGIDAGDLDGPVLRTADALARQLGRRVGIVHVRPSGDEGAMLRVMSHTREVAPEIAASATISVMRVEHSIAGTVAEHARRLHAGLLVVGTHARRTIERWMLGSTAEALVHAADLPFLVVRQS